jgi:two-component system, OmpR family, KDP operon response regulator KdpE
VSRSKPCILIVEDDAGIAIGLQWILEAEGIAVHVESLAKDVLPAIERLEPDLMFLDLSLKNGDAHFIYRSLAHRLPIILSTGSFEDLELLSAHEHVILLMKPFTTEELLRAIHQTLAPAS